jgi:hypothetical protein
LVALDAEIARLQATQGWKLVSKIE